VRMILSLETINCVNFVCGNISKSGTTTKKVNP